MTATAHTRKPSDDHSKFSYTLRDRNGDPIDVSSATSVDLYVDAEDGTAVVNGAAATLEDAANGKVSYVFGSAELDAVGTYYAEFVINRGTGTSYEPVPQDRNLRIEVREDVQTGSPTVNGAPFHTRKPGDDHTKFQTTLRNRAGYAIDLSTVSGVSVWADAPDGTAELSGVAATLDDAPNGVVSYTPASGEFNTPGVYPIEFVITYGDGSTYPLPHGENLKLVVTEDVK
ncbi:BppU family phage baseplate upper protein [Halopelagius fulvigenes]|uniref:BppU family phage baseplate upper protein n=1 Tax=Halopelagius fulvigenes TaxID=1198324 RepID=A0ABD5TZ51_9EURY